MSPPVKRNTAGSDARLATRVAQRYSGSKAVALNQDFWMTASEIATLCPPCGRRMASLNIRKLRASTVFGLDLLRLAATAHTADAWKDLPEGWNDESRQKFWESIGGSADECQKKVVGHVTDPKAFYEALKDRIEGTGWLAPKE